MSRTKETNAKTGLLSPLAKKGQACIAPLVKIGFHWELAIVACKEFAMKKVFPKRTTEIVK